MSEASPSALLPTMETMAQERDAKLVTALLKCAESIKDAVPEARVALYGCLESGGVLPEKPVDKLFTICQESFRDIRMQAGDKSVSLPARMVKHDANTTLVYLGIALNDLKTAISKHDSASLEQHIKQCRVQVELVCSIGATMGFLSASPPDAPRFIVPIAAPPFAAALQARYPGLSANLGKDTIMSHQAFVASQLVKNVPAGALDVTCSLQRIDDASLLVVQDRGPGIRSADGRPFPQGQLQNIFGDFSTRPGGGLGLQLVWAIIEKAGGAIAVQTKCQDSETGAYSSSDTFRPNVPAPQHTGTTFAVQLPNRL